MGREEILRHTFQVCNLPGWLGDVQVRTWKFEEDDNVLVLGSEEPTEIRVSLCMLQKVVLWVIVVLTCGYRVTKESQS
jgi:hypothetical protein